MIDSVQQMNNDIILQGIYAKKTPFRKYKNEGKCVQMVCVLCEITNQIKTSILHTI